MGPALAPFPSLTVELDDSEQGADVDWEVPTPDVGGIAKVTILTRTRRNAVHLYEGLQPSFCRLEKTEELSLV